MKVHLRSMAIYTYTIVTSDSSCIGMAVVCANDPSEARALLKSKHAKYRYYKRTGSLEIHCSSNSPHRVNWPFIVAFQKPQEV